MGCLYLPIYTALTFHALRLPLGTYALFVFLQA